MSPYDRLMAEAIPIRPVDPNRRPWTQQEQDAHWAALCTVVGTPGAQRPNHTENTAQNAA
ncbi:hypothetical protein HZZ00_10965 [Streptomyces sp. NEAU-sy36]|uniref:hypothetical protein n=1 Tax=unclassified Streptomyces TaxID=2593676 RepID=UPI0015D57D65|nr:MULTISPECIES: hypothetical protein [unclassified Streptomyces]QLJ01491.1 hypothetical protein HZZ00_10965 [Streptomyces sp. NEAU-sy36]